jgi:sporulation-control protein
MFGKVLSSLGIGGATVDTVLEHEALAPGDTLRAEIRIPGGNAAQEIRAAHLSLVTRCLVEGPHGRRHGDIVLVEGQAPIGRIEAGESLTLPIEMDLPRAAPITIGSTSTRLETRLEVPGAVDPRDSDPVTIRPGATMARVLQGIEAAGFRLSEAEVEYQPRRDPPFLQEFDFRPVGLGDLGIEEVEVAFLPYAGGVELLLTVDRRGGLFMGGGERMMRLRIDDAEAGRVDMAAELRRVIERLR